MATIGQLQKHGVGCTCTKCYGSYRAAAGSGKFDKESALAEAKSMHHNSMRQKHNSMIWGDTGGPKQTVEQKADHLLAANAHEKASHHFGQAARAFGEDRPAAAKEHLKFGEEHAEKANKLSEKCDM